MMSILFLILSFLQINAFSGPTGPMGPKGPNDKVFEIKGINSMNFNLEKNSLWLSYPLKKTSFSKIDKLIPDTHKIAKCKVFEDDEFDYRIFFNIFQVKTPFFSGDRMEIVTITKNINNNKLSFVILDCFTNVMSWDPIDGIKESNCKIKKKINNKFYNIYVNNKYHKENKKVNNKEKIEKSTLLNIISYKSKIKKRVLKKFSIEPNYICYFMNFPNGYKLYY